jgi:hypothetical protein
LLNARPTPVNNPPPKGLFHDYPYFGIRQSGTLCAYAGCLIAGEVCLLEHIYGHAEHQPNGVVPMLLISMADYLLKTHPGVKYYVYGTYFGAQDTMRRFKAKFRFLPHRVTWLLSDPAPGAALREAAPTQVAALG